MTSAVDVAAYILARKGPMTAMKLQKLVYYSQAWSLVWEERPLFEGRIEAWANGPVSPQLYEHHRGQFTVTALPSGDPNILSKNDCETIDAVLTYYGDKTAQWLSDLTHLEDPWRNARGTLPSGSFSNTEITHAAMAEYYGSIPVGA